MSSTGAWYQHDGLGSVRAVLDGAGAVQTTTSYDPWGVPTAGSIDPFGFTGELHDGDLVHLRARWYHPSTGTFTARDPFAGVDTLPYSLHPYQYAYSNPVLLTDPSGRVVPDEPGPPITTWDAFQNRYGYFDLRATPEDWERLGYTPEDATRYAFAYERYLQNPRAFIAQHPPGTWSYADAQLFAEHFLRRYFQAPVEMAVEEELLAFFDRVGTDPWTAEDRQCYIDLMIPFGFFNYEPMYGPFGKGGGGGGGGNKGLGSDSVSDSTKLPRYNGPKPTYTINPAHVRGQHLNPRKTPLPPDAEEVFRTAVPDDPVRPRNWFGKNASGQIYRFSVDNNNMAHFSGIDGVGDGIRNVTPYARKRLAQLP